MNPEIKHFNGDVCDLSEETVDQLVTGSNVSKEGKCTYCSSTNNTRHKQILTWAKFCPQCGRKLR